MYQVYEIMDNDTLDSLALRMNIDSDELCRLNGMNVSEFVPGEFIVVPKDKELFYSYFVKQGDTLYDISERYNVDLNTLYSINGLDDGDYIYPNQELLVPKDDFMLYVTKDGDNLNGISSNFGVSYSDLYSSVSNLYLVPGQLVIYKRD